MFMYCYNCGKENSDHAESCNSCGAGLNDGAIKKVYVPVFEQQVKIPGKNFLKVTGILTIILGGFAFIGFLMAMADPSAQFMIEQSTIYPVSISFLISMYFLAVGIMGVVWCQKIEKAKLLMGLITVYMILEGLPLLINLFRNPSIASIIGIAVTFVIPVLFLIGAVKNNNMYTYNRWENRNNPSDRY
jgi:hypothetical protein